MKRIYVAGPYRAATVAGVVTNIRRAEATGIAAMQLGWAPFIPHMNTALWDGLFPDSVFLESGLAFLGVCDAVVLVPGWLDSKGTLADIDMAKRLGIPVYETHELAKAKP